MDPLTLETPGKINLYLKVEGRRADGWHNLLTVFYPVPGLFDRITLRFGGEGVRIVCDAPGVPLDHGNLAVKGQQGSQQKEKKHRFSHSIKSLSNYVAKVIQINETNKL